MTIWKEAGRFSYCALSSIFSLLKSFSSLVSGTPAGFRIRMAPALSLAGSIFPALNLLGANGMSMTPAWKARTVPTARSPSPSSNTLSTMQRVSAEMIIISCTTWLVLDNSWSPSMLMICLVQRRPCALASLVGTPMASCGVLTMTLVALDRAAMVLPQEITEKAWASSCGKPPIHWCSTVVTSTSS